MHSPLQSAIAGDPEVEALLSDESHIAAILRFEVALAQAEADAGLISHAAAVAISASVQRFSPDWSKLAAGMRRDGVVVPSLIAQLRETIEQPYGSDLHRGATSQDAIDTALMLQLAQILPLLLERIDLVERLIAGLGERHGKNRLMAHTRMQAALPFAVADKLKTWGEPLLRHRAVLAAMREDLLVVQLGGPIGDRSTFEGKGDAVAKGLAERLGLGLAQPWHSARDRIASIGTALSHLTGSLGKIGADIALMAQTEVGSIVLAGGGASSAMPHKANPISAEVLIALARHTATLSASLGQALVHEGERSGAAWTIEWLTLPPLIVATGSSLLTSARLLEQVLDMGQH